MSGAKTWEIRGNSCPHLGLIVLYKVGCKRIVGMVRIVESKLLQDEELSQNIEKHCIADWSRNDFVRNYSERNGVYAWVMANPIAIEPIYGSLGLSMVWVPLHRFYKLPNMPLAFAAQAGKLVPSKRRRWVQQCKVERPSKCRTFASRVGKRNCNETENLFLGLLAAILERKVVISAVVVF